jgi:hypothetical protein
VRKSAHEKLQDARRASVGGALPAFTSLDDFYAYLLGGPMNPTQKRFIYGSEFARAYKGPAGCAKTSTLAAFAIGRALLVPGSRIFVSRANYNDILETTWTTFQTMLSKLPPGVVVERRKAPPMTLTIRPIATTNTDGLTTEADLYSTITFMGLTDALGSIEATCWLVDEADEVDEARAQEITSRLRAKGDKRDYVAAFVFNPPSKTHWLYTACTGLDAQEVPVKEPWMALYEPEPRENIHNLPEGYYERAASAMSVEQRTRLIEGKWGSSFQGQPVYRQFKEHIHVRRGLAFNKHATLYRFWDFGYNRPVCIFAQKDPFGRVKHLREVIGHQEEARAFARRVKAIQAEKFPEARDVMDFGDPAVNQHKDTGNTLYELHKEGITMFYRTGQKIMDGVQLIQQRLELLIDGEPALQWDEQFCPVTIDAFKGGYVLDRLGEKPVKDGFYEHPADADRYGIINILGGGYTTANLPDSLEYDPSQDN